MLLKFRHFILCFIFICVQQETFGQKEQNINPEGFNTFYYADGTKSSEGTLHKGKPDGYWKSYHENGVLKIGRKQIKFSA